MKFLRELNSMASVAPSVEAPRLTFTQKCVLAAIYAAPTPELAYDAMTGSDNVSEAGKQLRGMGLIMVDSIAGRAGVTDSGQTMLANNNLIDDIGELTEEGQKCVEEHKRIKVEFENATESVAFSVLKDLI